MYLSSRPAAGRPDRHLAPAAARDGRHHVPLEAGLISVPSSAFRRGGPRVPLQNSGARAIVTDRDQLPKLTSLRERLPELQTVLCVDVCGGALDLHALLAKASDRFEAKDTLADDPAFIIYTSAPRPQKARFIAPGAARHLPGVEYPHDGFPQSGDRFWTPADWRGSAASSTSSCRPGSRRLRVAHRPRKFDPAEAMRLMARHGCATSSCRRPR